MVLKDKSQRVFLNELGLKPFKEGFPWLGGDLQTLRDTFIKEELPIKSSELIGIEVPSMPIGVESSGRLIAFLDYPRNDIPLIGLVVMLHGLGGSSNRQGLRRMGCTLNDAGFAVLKVNLRGSDPSRNFARGTYSAKCNTDLQPVLLKARELCHSIAKDKNGSLNSLPLLGVGISLGGTILLNACLELTSFHSFLPLDGLVCISSPLDLAECSAAIERPRNKIYQSWLLQRLVKQTLSDPFGISEVERKYLTKKTFFNFSLANSIREFDSLISAPRWGFKDVDDYYLNASPLNFLLNNPLHIPKTFCIQSLDDPWVPSDGAEALFKMVKSIGVTSQIDVFLTSQGGHNGFHGNGQCWGDHLVRNLLLKLVS